MTARTVAPRPARQRPPPDNGEQCGCHEDSDGSENTRGALDRQRCYKSATLTRRCGMDTAVDASEMSRGGTSAVAQSAFREELQNTTRPHTTQHHDKAWQQRGIDSGRAATRSCARAGGNPPPHVIKRIPSRTTTGSPRQHRCALCTTKVLVQHDTDTRRHMERQAATTQRAQGRATAAQRRTYCRRRRRGLPRADDRVQRRQRGGEQSTNEGHGGVEQAGSSDVRRRRHGRLWPAPWAAHRPSFRAFLRKRGRRRDAPPHTR
jgi:hypothetical protein